MQHKQNAEFPFRSESTKTHKALWYDGPVGGLIEKGVPRVHAGNPTVHLKKLAVTRAPQD
jgi:hypothetical protein